MKNENVVYENMNDLNGKYLKSAAGYNLHFDCTNKPLTYIAH